MQFDMKQALFYFMDGFTAPAAAVNLMAGYVAGTTTIAVDGISGVIPNGVSFTMPEGRTLYTVVSSTATLGNTTGITFSPGLVDAAVDDDVITWGGRLLKMKIGDGTMSVDEKRIVEYKKDRGLLDTVRLGDQEPIDVKLELRWEFLMADSTDPATSSIPSPEDVLKQRGVASGWQTTSPDPCEPYCVDIYVIYTPLCPNVKCEGYLLHMFRYEALNHDFKQGMINMTGKCNVQQMTVSRFTNLPL